MVSTTLRSFVQRNITHRTLERLHGMGRQGPTNLNLGPEDLTEVLQDSINSLALLKLSRLGKGVVDGLGEQRAELHVVSVAGAWRTEIDVSLREQVARRHYDGLFGLGIFVACLLRVVGIRSDAEVEQ